MPSIATLGTGQGAVPIEIAAVELQFTLHVPKPQQKGGGMFAWPKIWSNANLQMDNAHINDSEALWYKICEATYNA